MERQLKLASRLNKLEQVAGAEGEKRRLVLYYKPTEPHYRAIGHEYTEDDLPRLRVQYDLLIIYDSRDINEPEKQSQ